MTSEELDEPGQSARPRRVGNLPVPATRLVGRRDELAQLRRMLLNRSRLVTLSGVGGVGKTRLATELAAQLQPEFREGAWLVELSPLRQGDLLALTIAEALPLADQTTRPVIDVLAEYLADRELLLVLDTCEHLTETCALTAQILLRAAPGLRILTTGRRTLGIPEESVFTLDPLPVPDAPDTAQQDTPDAVVLLAERAAQAVPGFAVEANRAELVRLCRRLEGLPLAIELAAARLREFSPGELTARLDDRFSVLGDTEHVVHDADPPWHQALRTAIGWSHQLCSPPERLLWARLSVFSGSFHLWSARQVCADEMLPAHRIPGLLTALADKSILSWQPTGDGERYRLLDTIREYGAHWLRGLGEEDTLRHRHLEHYLRLARAGDAAWIGPDQYSWYDRMTAEHDNLRTALEHSLTLQEGRTALELAAALWFFWYGCGFLKEGRHYLDRALAADTSPSRERAKAIYACGPLLVYLGDLPALELRAAECTALAAQFGDTERTYAAATELRVAALRGDPKQLVSMTEALLATDWREKPLTLIPLAALVHGAHGQVAWGRYEEAIAWLDELSAVCDRNGERCMRAWGDFVRALAELALGQFHQAQQHARAALLVKHRLRDGVGSGMALEALARAAAAMGQSPEAAWLLGLATQLWDTLGRPQSGVPAVVAARNSCESQTRTTLGNPTFTHTFRTGYDTPLEAGIAQALDTAP